MLTDVPDQARRSLARRSDIAARLGRDGSDSGGSRLFGGLRSGESAILDRVRGGTSESTCDCSAAVEDGTLVVDAGDCDGELAGAPACRRTVVRKLARREANDLVVRSNGLAYRYDERALALLSAAGRFVDLLGDRNDGLGEEAARDPLAVATELEDRLDPIADVGAESGLLRAAADVDDYETLLTPSVGLTVGHYFVDESVADRARLRGIQTLDTGSEVRTYTRADDVPLYAVAPIEITLSADDRGLLLEGYEAIADGVVEGAHVASRAVRHVSDGSVDPRVAAVLEKHTSGYGILEDLFADPRVSDVYVTSPVTSNPLRVEVGGEAMTTNVSLTPDGARALASRVRRTSGRSFSRANPTVDATVALANGTGVRIAGVTDPVADGVAFAFRERADDRFTLPGLIANGTLSADAAAFLSVAIERNAATLVAGTRGAGKTTLLGSLLYELSPDTRTVVIEDTPELPVGPLQSVGRDVQALRTGTGEGPEIHPSEALTTALRLGDGALVVGEIRGEEAAVLYEAMRVGANANAVLGTIHGDGAADAYERVVSDLGVAPTSFGATDLVVTVQAYRTADGRERRLAAIEEVITSGTEVRFAPLYEIPGDRDMREGYEIQGDCVTRGDHETRDDREKLDDHESRSGREIADARAVPTGRVDRGESRFVDRQTGPAETYADVRRAIDERRKLLSSLARDGRTRPQEVAAAYASRGAERAAT